MSNSRRLEFLLTFLIYASLGAVLSYQAFTSGMLVMGWFMAAVSLMGASFAVVVVCDYLRDRL